jgi:arginase
VGGFAEAFDAHGRIGLLWMDAHLDSNTPSTSPSQAVHGMGLAALLGHGAPVLTAIGGEAPTVKPEHVCVVGMRDADDPELALLHELGVAIFTTDDIRQMGVERVMDRAVDIVARGTDYHYLSFCVDVFDPELAPGVSAPAPNGLNRDEVQAMLRQLFDTLHVHGMDIAEFNPARDQNHRTERLVHEVIVQALSRL